ncbi:BQ2448_6895 [Microbotryum intermedium]|uniref:BQ2448_6895 protein n=1 Tax=Microbotryum intermedium TaxID=269621 RepID=A0A238FGN8_9BASI|nr:BQ2448_6895 [Microbotryum intermedium]
MGLLTRINWPVWAPAMRMALQSISAYRVATGEQAKPTAVQPRNQSLKDCTSLYNNYDQKDAKGRTLIRENVDDNTWFKLKGGAQENSVPFVGTKTLRAYWNLRYEPGTSVASFITDVERLGELCNRQNFANWLQTLNITHKDLQSMYDTMVSVIGQERGEALQVMVLHVDPFAVKTVLMEQLPDKNTFAFREESDVDKFIEKVKTAYEEDVIMNGAGNDRQTEQPASAFAASHREATQGQANSGNGNCSCPNHAQAFAATGQAGSQAGSQAGPARNSHRSERFGRRSGAKSRAEHYSNSEKWGKISDGKFVCANNQRMNCFDFGHRKAACTSKDPTGDRLRYLQSLDINVPLQNHAFYFVEDPIPMNLADRMGTSIHFTNYVSEVNEQTIFRAATAEDPELIFDTGAPTSLVNDKSLLCDYETLDSPTDMIDAAGNRTPAAGRGTLKTEFKLADGTTGNGVAERSWRTMFEMVRIWLLVSGMPLSFWSFAAEAFTYVSNRLSRIRVWGCVAYVRIPPERRASKIEPPRIKARFIGYTDQGWRFWRPDTNVVFVSDDATFDETSFELRREDADSDVLSQASACNLFGTADPGDDDGGDLPPVNPPSPLPLDGADDHDAVDRDSAPADVGRAPAPGIDGRAPAPAAAGRALAPDNNGRDIPSTPVGRAIAPGRESSNPPVAPGRARTSANKGRVPQGDGRALAPIAGRRPSPFLDDGADNNPPDSPQTPEGCEPVVPTTERTSELAERSGAPAGSRRRGGAREQSMFFDVGTILGDDVIPLNEYVKSNQARYKTKQNELPKWEQVLNVVVNLDKCDGWTNLSSIIQGSTEGIDGIEELEAYQVWTGSPDEPTYKQAIAGEDSEDWSISLMAEYAVLNGMKTWDQEASDPPPGVRGIPIVLIRKRNDKGDIKYKARINHRSWRSPESSLVEISRIIARGDLQNHRGQTSSPTARIASIRMLNVIAHVKGYRRIQFDVNSAYLHGHISEPIWIKLPDGSTHRLRKSLYGLKQSGREWNKVLHAALVDRGFQRMEDDFGTYRRVRNVGGVDRTTLLAIYVDDGILAGDDDLEGFLSEFDKQFKLKLGEVKLFLGMRITTDEASGIMTIDQWHQIENILNNHGFSNASVASTPTSDSDAHADGGIAHLKLNYRRVVGELLWVSGCTRPDISYAVTQLSRHCADPKPKHFRQMRRVLRYLRGTIKSNHECLI